MPQTRLFLSARYPGSLNMAAVPSWKRQRTQSCNATLRRLWCPTQREGGSALRSHALTQPPLRVPGCLLVERGSDPPPPEPRPPHFGHHFHTWTPRRSSTGRRCSETTRLAHRVRPASFYAHWKPSPTPVGTPAPVLVPASLTPRVGSWWVHFIALFVRTLWAYNFHAQSPHCALDTVPCCLNLRRPCAQPIPQSGHNARMRTRSRACRPNACSSQPPVNLSSPLNPQRKGSFGWRVRARGCSSYDS